MPTSIMFTQCSIYVMYKVDTLSIYQDKHTGIHYIHCTRVTYTDNFCV